MKFKNCWDKALKFENRQLILTDFTEDFGELPIIWVETF